MGHTQWKSSPGLLQHPSDRAMEAGKRRLSLSGKGSHVILLSGAKKSHRS